MLEVVSRVATLPEGQRSQYTAERHGLMAGAALEREWVRNTDPALLGQLGSLPANWDNFVKATAFHPDVIDAGGPGETRVIRLAQLHRANFLGIPVFDIENAKGTKYQYEFGQWRHGPEAGAKGLIVVRDTEGKPSALMMLFGGKFSLGRKAYDMPGGFAEPEDASATNSLAQGFIREVKEETGRDDLEVGDVADLGSMYTDPGMTNNTPRLFGGTVETKKGLDVTERDHDNLDPYELTAKAVLIPLDQIPQLVRSDHTDGLFHAALTKAIVSPDMPRDVRLALVRGLAADLLSDLAVAGEVQKPQDFQRLRKVASAVGKTLLSPLKFSVDISKDVNRVSKIIREERREAGRPYVRGTGVARSVPAATGRMVWQGWRDLGDLRQYLEDFQPTRPPRRPI